MIACVAALGVVSIVTMIWVDAFSYHWWNRLAAVSLSVGLIAMLIWTGKENLPGRTSTRLQRISTAFFGLSFSCYAVSSWLSDTGALGVAVTILATIFGVVTLYFAVSFPPDSSKLVDKD